MPKRAVLLAASLAAACGSVHDRGECSASTDCPLGEYCAATPDGNVCWPDATGPGLTVVGAACAGGCKRDGKLVVDATASDAESGILAATATLTIGATTYGFPLLHQGGDAYRGQLDLAAVSFPYFTTDGSLGVAVTNGARTTMAAAPPEIVPITRLKWTYSMDALALTAAAVMSDGTAVVGRAATTDQVLAVRPDGTKAWSLTVEAAAGAGQPVTRPPSIGQDAIWVTSDDGRFYGMALDGSGLLTGKGCNISGTVTGPPALRPSDATDTVFVGASDGSIWGTTANPNDCNPSNPATAYAVSPVIDAAGGLYAATNAALLRRFAFNGLLFSEPWVTAVDVGTTIEAPLAIDSVGDVWTASLTGELKRTTSAGDPGASVSRSTPLRESPIVLTGDDVVVGDETGEVNRFSRTGTALWATPPNVGAAALSPIALAGGDASFVVSTKGGKVYAIADDGHIVWSATLPSPELRTGNIYTAPGSSVSTAYFAAKDGKLHAVIVDGHLDASAPWPKAWHDPRNTSNAATPF